MKTLTVKEAVDRVNSGKDLKGFVLDKDTSLQVKVSDALVINRGGIVIPEENLFYDDSEIQYDEEIDELVIGEEITGMSWDEKSRIVRNESDNKFDSMLKISTQQPEIDSWIQANKSKIEELLKPIVVSLFNAEKALNK